MTRIIDYPLRPYRTESIILHHSLTKDGKVVNFNAIKKYHLGLGWIDIGYHFVLERVDDDINIFVGRPLYSIGAHTRQKQANLKSVGVCMVGNFDEDDPHIYYPKLIPLVAHLLWCFNLGVDAIRGHREFAPYKTCPGKNVDLEEIKELVKNHKNRFRRS